MLTDVQLHRTPLDPIHQQHRELRLTTHAAIDKELPLVVAHRGEVGRASHLQLLLDLAIGFCTSLLLFGKAFERIELPRVRIAHLKDHGKGSATAVRLPMLVLHHL